ncbi:MAG: ATP-binding protein [Polyangiaceae bacterium]|nr:ATP-binding protein [Polyangiaceae bacterium]
MKFEFRNLGTIKTTMLDLRPLTVIIGPNNTYKTYLASCVHGLMRELQSYAQLFRSKEAKRRDSIEIQDVQRICDSVATQFSRRLPEYFQDTRRNIFKTTSVALQIDDRDLTQKFNTVSGLNTETSNGYSAVMRVALGELFRQPLFLPAERNAFIITYKMLSARRYRVLRTWQRRLGDFDFLLEEPQAQEAREREVALLREQGDIRYPGPIEDFLDFLTDVELEAARIKNDAKSPFGKIAAAIETRIQSGHRTSYEATVLGGRELALTVSDQVRIDLHNASSSVKQLAPLLLYLRYRAAPRQTLIIDEPEMNLHPEGQAKLLEALGMLANLGVNVLLTTHSPYFMAHLQNLVAADRKSVARKKRQAKHLYMGDPAAFLAPNDVSAYEMKSEGLASLQDPEYGIRWDTLSDVSSELQRRFFAIVEEPEGRGKTKK